MSFFAPLPDKGPVKEEQPERVERKPAPLWKMPPEGVFFGVVPFREAMARTPEVCILVDRVLADTHGLIVQLQLFLAEPLDDDRYVDGLFPWGITEQQLGHRTGPFDRYVSPADQMRFGVVLDDGRKAVSKTRQEVAESGRRSDRGRTKSRTDRSAPAVPTIESLGGGGGWLKAESGEWIYTADYTGSVTLVIEWPVFDIGETELTIPGDVIEIGRQEIETLW